MTFFSSFPTLSPFSALFAFCAFLFSLFIFSIYFRNILCYFIFLFPFPIIPALPPSASTKHEDSSSTHQHSAPILHLPPSYMNLPKISKRSKQGKKQVMCEWESEVLLRTARWNLSGVSPKRKKNKTMSKGCICRVGVVAGCKRRVRVCLTEAICGCDESFWPQALCQSVRQEYNWMHSVS